MRSKRIWLGSAFLVGLVGVGVGACSNDSTTNTSGNTTGDGTQTPTTAVTTTLGLGLQTLNVCRSLSGAAATFSAQTIQGQKVGELSTPAEVTEFALLKAAPGLANFEDTSLVSATATTTTGSTTGTTATTTTTTTTTTQPSIASGVVRIISKSIAVNSRDLSGQVIYADVCGLPTITSESGFYEMWLVDDLRVPFVAPVDAQGHAQFGTITQADADALAAIGSGNDVPGAIFTIDGNAVNAGTSSTSTGVPANGQVAGSLTTNTVPLFVSMGAFNTLEGSDGHARSEFTNRTNWAFPTYELPGTGGDATAYSEGLQYAPLGTPGPNVDSRIPGSGPNGILNNASVAGKILYGDNPSNPRDPDRLFLSKTTSTTTTTNTQTTTVTLGASVESRLRGIPSALAREVLLDVYMRPVSSGLSQADSVADRITQAYAAEVARFDTNHNGIIDYQEAANAQVTVVVNTGTTVQKTHDTTTTTTTNTNTNTGTGTTTPGTGTETTVSVSLFLSLTDFDRVVVTRELNDGLLSPRLAPTTVAHVLEGALTLGGATSGTTTTTTQTGGNTTTGATPSTGGTGTTTVTGIPTVTIPPTTTPVTPSTPGGLY